MEHITAVLKIALLQTQFILFLFAFFFFSLPNALIFFFFFFHTSLRSKMSKEEKACQLIYQLAASLQLSVLLGLHGWGCGTVGLNQLLWLPVCHGSGYMAVKHRGTGWQRRYHGYYIVVTPEVLNLYAEQALDHTAKRIKRCLEVRVKEFMSIWVGLTWRHTELDLCSLTTNI